MPVPSTINDLSTTAASNSPSGGENPFPDLDNYLRSHASFIAALRDGKLDASAVSAYMRTVLNDADAATARATLGAVGLTGSETIAGVKTFSSSPLLPGNASTALQPVPKQQLDSVSATLSALSFSGLSLSASGTSAGVSIAAGEVLLRSADGTPKLASAVSLTVDTSTVGANGLDTGTLAASTWYAVWVISNGTTTAGLVSLSSTAPTMPSGYTFKARVGWIRTDGTASKFPLAFKQHGCGVEYEPSSGANLPTYPLIASTNTSIGVTSVSMSNAVPSTAGNVHLRIRQDSVANTANGANVYTTASGESQAAAIGVNGSQGLARATVKPQTAGTVYWAVSTSTGSATLAVIGWEDNL